VFEIGFKVSFSRIRSHSHGEFDSFENSILDTSSRIFSNNLDTLTQHPPRHQHHCQVLFAAATHFPLRPLYKMHPRTTREAHSSCHSSLRKLGLGRWAIRLQPFAFGVGACVRKRARARAVAAHGRVDGSAGVRCRAIARLRQAALLRVVLLELFCG
jgi:hypothetical protein